MKGFRIFLLVLAASLLIGGAGLLVLWYRYGDALVAEFERIQNDALAFAAEHEQEDCVPEAFGRLETCDGVWCKVQTPLFARECLRNAKPTEALCDSVPDAMSDARQWSVDTCGDIDAEPAVCERILRELVEVCVPS